MAYNFWYVIPADYERWLEELALKGWHPQKIGQFSSIAMTFVKTEPKKYRYVFDLQAMPKADYKLTYETFGWEFVGQMASAFVWRKQYENERPESFSDNETRMARSKRFIAAISFSFVLFLLASLIILTYFIWNFNKLTVNELLQFILGLSLSIGFTIYLGYVMRRISKSRDR
ncbi:MAG: DUF2812 domain-containing protein [Muricomes sp.]